jgi:hypothetical protein
MTKVCERLTGRKAPHKVSERLIQRKAHAAVAKVSDRQFQHHVGSHYVYPWTPVAFLVY